MAAMYATEGRRWLLLAVIALLNFTNAMTWISFAPVAYFTNAFYGSDLATVLFNTSFMVVSIPVGFVAMWGVDRFGLRPTIFFSSALNLAGNALRLLGSCPLIHDATWRLVLAMFGQMVAAVAQPFIMYLPTKMAALWFADSERLLANTLASMSNPLGVAAMYMIAPLIIHSGQPSEFFEMTGICAASTLVTFVLSLFITRSKPLTPPSSSSELLGKENVNFREDLKGMLKNKQFVILAVSVGSSVGLFNCLYNNLEPALCSRGYSNIYIGLVGAGMIVSGLVGSAIVGLIVDRTKKFMLMYKTCIAFTGLAAVLLVIFMNMSYQPVLVAIMLLAFGFFGFPTYPIGLELAVETTFPTPEATSSGFLIMAGQVFGIVYIVLTTMTTLEPSTHTRAVQTCLELDKSADILEWKCSNYVWAACTVATVGGAAAFFWPKLRRLDYERNRDKASTSR